MSTLLIPNPKRRVTDLEGRFGWYPFYAGFSADFAGWALDHVLEDPGGLLLDPWNGAGTSTLAASLRGMRAIGIDLNPAMVIAARAQLLDSTELRSIRKMSRYIANDAKRKSPMYTAATEPLSALASTTTALALRRLEHSICRLCDGSAVPDNGPAFVRAERLTPTACFFYVALFRALRTLIRGRAVSNPTWTRLPAADSSRSRASADTVLQRFLAEVDTMLDLVTTPETTLEPKQISVRVDSSTKLEAVPRRAADLILTSPPYCTRMDYAVATLPELLVIGYDYATTFKALRRTLLGTTTVPEDVAGRRREWGRTCTRLLAAMKRHPSIASGTYYYKSHYQYFDGLFASIGQLATRLRRRGRAVLVVQDSHYKDLHNDLPRIVSEMAIEHGLELARRADFPVRNPLAGSNPRTRSYRTSVVATESVLLLER
jgi:hypothetical protein